MPITDAVRKEVVDAIARKLHLGREPRVSYGVYGITWDYPVGIEGEEILLRDSDCGAGKSVIRIDEAEWKRRMDQFGLFKQIGFWAFTPADDPAVSEKRMAHQSPDWAGQEVYDLRREVEAQKARWESLQRFVTGIERTAGYKGTAELRQELVRISVKMEEK